jgi:hypothetical protein
MIGIKIPGLVSLSSPFLVAWALSPLILVLLYPLNEKVKIWRKARGRDIDEEERYETPDGMIKLTPNEPSGEKDATSQILSTPGEIFRRPPSS